MDTQGAHTFTEQELRNLGAVNLHLNIPFPLIVPCDIRLEIEKAGEEISTLPVFISYNIIDLFSGHLYSNPAKAIEELVVNAYDAFAKTCHVIIPDNWDAVDARVIVWDDGDSMDLEGLKELWLIANTHKRDPQRERDAEKRGRLPIGKFGIGKLASYVVGRRISHVCKRGKKILAVTMDFSKVIPGESTPSEVEAKSPKPVVLSVRELKLEEAKEVLNFALSGELPKGIRLPLFGTEAPQNWTLVVVDRLKQQAKAILRGRLRWIISTALPLVPDFHVFLNGDKVIPSKLSQKVLKKWIVGKKDKEAQELGYEVGEDLKKQSPFDSWITIPGVGKVSGEFDLYEETLLGGKAEEIGRSHGFFVVARHRLINHDEPLFGIHVLSHATFNRLHAVIHADDLDKELVASREGVSEESRKALEKYLVAKFNAVRGWYEEHLSETAKEEGIVERLASVPGPLMRFPIKHAVDRAIHDEQLIPFTIRLPLEEKAEVVDLIKGFELASLETTDSLAVFDASTGTVKINTNHPYYVNYSESLGMESFAAGEVLLEAYLCESSLPPSEIRELLERRDQLLRALVRERPLSVTAISQQLRDSVRSESEMEHSCHRAFRALGFEVVPLGDSGKPDGLATAVLAPRYGRKTDDVESHSYKFTYDAKSTGHDRVKSADLHLSTVALHRDNYHASYAVVIANDFETAELGEASKAIKEARKQQVCLMRANDLADLVEASGVKPLPLSKLEELFKTSRSPDEAHRWIDAFRAEKGKPLDLRMILDRVFELQKEKPLDPPSFGAIKYRDGELEATERQIKEWLTALSRLLPDLIYVYDDKVELHQKPEIIVGLFRKSLRETEMKESSQAHPHV